MQRKVCWAYKLVHSRARGFFLITLHIFTLGSRPVEPQPSAYCSPEQLRAKFLAQGHIDRNSLSLNNQILPTGQQTGRIWTSDLIATSVPDVQMLCFTKSLEEQLLLGRPHSPPPTPHHATLLTKKTSHVIKCSLKANRAAKGQKKYRRNSRTFLSSLLLF